MFQHDDYIVILKDDAKDNNWKNFVFKQKIQRYCVDPYINVDGKKNNSYSYCHFEQSEVWRYATPEEIAEYERLGKPFDVTTIVSVPVNNDYTYLVKFLKKLGIK